jgi:hypothetical protein
VTTLKLQDPTEPIQDFLKKNLDTNELGLGDGHALCYEITEPLFLAQEADCSARSFGLDDIRAKALRIDLSWRANPDVVGNMHKIWAIRNSLKLRIDQHLVSA